MTKPRLATLEHKLDTLMDSYVPTRIPAVALAVAQRGQVLVERYWGWVDVDTHRWRVSANTYFDLASLTKLFVCTAFLRLVDEGRVKLDDPLMRIIPEFGGAPRPIDGGQDPHTKIALPVADDKVGQTVNPASVTFRHLLTHTSGLPPWRDVFNAVGDAPPPPDQHDPLMADRPERALSALCGYPFVSRPDGVVRYSDIGLMLLGKAVTRLTGKPLDIAIEKAMLFDNMPLYRPMKAWYHTHPIPRDQIAPTEMDATWRKRRIWGEVHDENASGLGGVAGHAGLFGTLGQVAYFGAQWLNNQLGLSDDLYRLATTQQAETKGERRGLGWMIKSLQGSSAGDLLSPNTFGHTGFTGTSLFIDPDHQLVVTLLTNAVYYGRDMMPSFEFRRAVHTLIAEALFA